jgi:hypothetical protein
MALFGTVCCSKNEKVLLNPSGPDTYVCRRNWSWPSSQLM